MHCAPRLPGEGGGHRQGHRREGGGNDGPTAAEGRGEGLDQGARVPGPYAEEPAGVRPPRTECCRRQASCVAQLRAGGHAELTPSNVDLLWLTCYLLTLLSAARGAHAAVHRSPYILSSTQEESGLDCAGLLRRQAPGYGLPPRAPPMCCAATPCRCGALPAYVPRHEVSPAVTCEPRLARTLLLLRWFHGERAFSICVIQTCPSAQGATCILKRDSLCRRWRERSPRQGRVRASSLWFAQRWFLAAWSRCIGDQCCCVPLIWSALYRATAGFGGGRSCCMARCDRCSAVAHRWRSAAPE